LIISRAQIDSVSNIQSNIFLLKAYSPDLVSKSYPGQFVNIKVTEGYYPLLRRPFSICDVEGDYVYFMFNIHGQGTKFLSAKAKGEPIDLLGPLGHGFEMDGNYDNAIIIGGGLGAAPFPFLTKSLYNRNILTLIGGRNKNDVITYGMKNVHTCTDDGSLGLKGNVLDLLKSILPDVKGKSRIFACGPTPMLKALQSFVIENNIECQMATECAMACGFGICQGCPIESAHDHETYKLVCKDGPVFNAGDIIL